MRTHKYLIVILLLSGMILFAKGKKPQEEIKKTFSVELGGTLKANVNPGEIRVNTWEKNEIIVRVVGLSKEDSKDLAIEKNGTTVTVNYSTGWGWSDDVQFRITMPARFNLDVKTTGGDVKLSDKITGYVVVNTSGGEITTDDITGDTRLVSSGGEIECGNIKGNLEISTMGGEITIKSVEGKTAEVNTMGGDIKIDNAKVDLDAKTYGGDIELGEVKGRAEVVTYGGDIYVEKAKGTLKVETYGGGIEVKEGEGRISAETKGGDIQLRNITGSIQAKTSAGRIEASLVPDNRDRSSLYTSNGSVDLYLPEDAKATVNAKIKIRGWWKEIKDYYKIESEFKETKATRDEDSKAIEKVFELNGGGAEINLTTINSRIRIMKNKNEGK